MSQFNIDKSERINYSVLYAIIALKLFQHLVIGNDIIEFYQYIILSLIPIVFLIVSVSFLVIDNKKYSGLSVLKIVSYIILAYLMFI